VATLIAEAKIASRRNSLTVTLPALVRNAFSCFSRTLIHSLSVLGRRRKASAAILEPKAFRQKERQLGRSSDNRRFRSPNYSAWRRSRTESLLSNARYFIDSPPCARCVRPLGAPRTAHFATPPLGAGALVLRWSCKPKLARISLDTRKPSLYRRNEISSETAGYIAFAAAAITGLRCAR
jgi:hypothetical protein